MSTLSITRNYADGEVLLEADLAEICDDVESFLNSELLGDVNLADAGITASDKLIDGSISSAKLAASVVTTAKIADNAVTDAKIVSGGLAAASLATNSVTTAKIVDSNVTTAKIADSNVTTAKIADSNVTTAKIADSNVTTAKIADGNVTPAKRSTCLQSQAAVTSISTSASHAVSFTGTGRPVLLTISKVGNVADVSGINWTITAGSKVSIYKNGVETIILGTDAGASSALTIPSLTFIDTSGYAGALSYDLRTNSGTATCAASAVYFSAIEL